MYFTPNRPAGELSDPVDLSSFCFRRIGDVAWVMQNKAFCSVMSIGCILFLFFSSRHLDLVYEMVSENPIGTRRQTESHP